jgi:hypothetical protein
VPAERLYAHSCRDCDDFVTKVRSPACARSS